jgi:hypothetical protein
LIDYAKDELKLDDYSGILIKSGEARQAIKKLDKTTDYVVKVDQGIKKRKKRGLLKIKVRSNDVLDILKKFTDKASIISRSNRTLYTRKIHFMLCTLGLAFSGQVMRWDEDAYWGNTVRTGVDCD